jgi:hypothetical protein
VSIKKFEPKEFKPERFESKGHEGRKTRLRYDDTGEIVVVDLHDMANFEEMMTNGRPVTILGFAD